MSNNIIFDKMFATVDIHSSLHITFKWICKIVLLLQDVRRCYTVSESWQHSKSGDDFKPNLR